jgi:hypothetical protein
MGHGVLTLKCSRRLGNGQETIDVGGIGVEGGDEPEGALARPR